MSCGCDVSCGDLLGMMSRMLGERSRGRETGINGGSRNSIYSGCSSHLVLSELRSRSGELDNLVEICGGSFEDAYEQVFPKLMYKTFNCVLFGLDKTTTQLAYV